jgi:hypothetical protein
MKRAPGYGGSLALHQFPRCNQFILLRATVYQTFFLAEAVELLLEADEELLLLKIESPTPLMKAIAEVCLKPARNAIAIDKAVMPT